MGIFFQEDPLNSTSRRTRGQLIHNGDPSASSAIARSVSCAGGAHSDEDDQDYDDNDGKNKDSDDDSSDDKNNSESNYAPHDDEESDYTSSLGSESLTLNTCSPRSKSLSLNIE